MIAVEVRPSPDGASLEPSAHRELFTTPIFRGGVQATNFKFQYALSADGTRFLINEVLEDEVPKPLIVVLNWKPPVQ